MSFSANVHPALGDALLGRGYESLTPVQIAMVEDDIAGRDLLVSAQTGSGKTVAFGLAMGSTLLGDEGRLPKAAEPAALVIAPTRELAMQVKAELTWLYAGAKAVIASCVGGMDIRRERRDLAQGCHIVVGTPGRLRDHIERSSLDLSWLKVAVLDEADEMLDLGFREDLEFILDAAPEERQTLLFSATVPPAIATLAKTFQRDAKRITTVEERKQHADIDYCAHLVAPRDKEKAVINVLRYHESPNAMIFCSTRDMVRHLSARLGNRGFSVVALSGELSQTERSQALQAMRDGRARVCVATDVAARGIDLPNLDLVIHADLPTNSETLLHRSGRTGRAGRQGHCALIVPANKRHVANRLLKFARLKAKWDPVPGLEAIDARDQERIFAHTLLQTPPDDDLQQKAQSLLGIYGPEQVAAAFLASQQAHYPAAEDVAPMEASDDRPGRDNRSRDDRGVRERASFEGGVWFSVNAGRKHKAEPRWLLPMICRIGGFTKKKVGFIRILDGETLFELSGDVAAGFEVNLALEGTGEKSLRINKLDGVPDLAQKPSGRPSGKPSGKPYGKHSGKPSGKFQGKPRGKPGKGFKSGHRKGDGARKHRGSDQ